MSLQSDCYPKTEEAIRLMKRKESNHINQSDCWFITWLAIRLKRPTLSLDITKAVGNLRRVAHKKYCFNPKFTLKTSMNHCFQD